MLTHLKKKQISIIHLKKYPQIKHKSKLSS